MTLSVEVQDQLLAFFKLMSNTQRIKIVGALATAGPLSADRLPVAADVSAADMTRHLKLLTDSGLVTLQADGAYAFDEHALEMAARQALAGQRQVAAAAATGNDDFERRTLRDYLDASGRLKMLPSNGKKLLVVLRYVNRVFAPGAKYTENDMNQTLARFHEDTATLRRALVDCKILARDHGAYWQVETETAQQSTETGRTTTS